MKCPYCAEEIKDEAIFCKFCKTNINKQPSDPNPRTGTAYDFTPEQIRNMTIGGLVVAIIIFIGISLNSLYPGYFRSSSISNPKITPATNEVAAPPTDNRTPEEKLAEANTVLKNNLNQAIAETSKFDGKSYKESADSLGNEERLFRKYGDLIAEASNNSDKGIKDLGAKLKNKLSQLQIGEFPKMRAAFAKFTQQAVWNNDVEVTQYGKTIELVGSEYVLNKNISESYLAIADSLKNFRFKTIIFRWYKDGDGKSAKVESPDDNVVLGTSD